MSRAFQTSTLYDDSSRNLSRGDVGNDCDSDGAHNKKAGEIPGFHCLDVTLSRLLFIDTRLPKQAGPVRVSINLNSHISPFTWLP